MIIVLSPAKTVDFSTALLVKPASKIVFPQESMLLNNLLKTLSINELQELMAISRELGNLNYHRIQDWHFPIQATKSQNAIFAFRGETYNGFDADTITPSELNTAQKQIVILSGLYGILRPLDAILPYRLEMGTKLTNPQGDNLYHFWREKITSHINQLVGQTTHQTLVNLASDEYFKSINAKEISGTIITPQFLDFSGGKYKVVSVFAKKARGSMARFLCSPTIGHPSNIIAFEGLGYHYNPQRSTPNNPVFVR